MFTPLPLRLCCLAAMAPALTEAASQAQNFKLPHSSDSQNTPVVVNGRTCRGPELPNWQNSCCGIARTSILNKATITSLPHKDLINLVTKGTVEVKSLRIHNSLSITKTNFGPLSSLPELLKKEILLKKANSNGSTISFSINANNSLSHQLTTMNKGSNSNINGMDKNKGSMGLCKSNDNSLINGGLTSGNSNVPSFANINNSEQKEEISTLDGNGTNKTKSNDENAKNLTSGMVICSEVSKRQAHLERKADRAMRRLRKLQIRQAQVHVREQLIAFLEHQRKTLQSLSRNTKISTPTSNCSAVEFKTELLQSEDVKNLSTAALVNLVRKLESTHGSALRQKLSSSGNKSSDRSEGGYIIKLNEDMCNEMKRAASTLECNLRHLERAIDSDATESSSGGESCDELEGYDDTKTNHTPTHRRGMWKWAVERTGVASRWTWLQAQVSDLEYRIRQQSDIYRQIRATKGCVVLGEAPSPEELLKQRIPNRTGKKLSPIEAKIANLEQRNEMSPSSLSTLLSNVDKQNVHLTSTSMACFTPVNNGKKQPTLQTSKLVNGFIDNNSNGSHGNHNKVDSFECDLDSSSKKSCTDIISGVQSPVVNTTCQAARVRPLKSFRKRKLFRPAGLHLVSRKAAKLSTLKCGCAPPFTPCAMCGGRYNNTQSLDPDTMSREERIAHLDASFHPVLSFPQDIPLPIHFEALLKSGEWQNKSPPKPVPNIKKKPKLFSPLSEHARKHSKKLARSAAATLLSTARLRKFGEKSLIKGHGNSIVSISKNSLSESRMIKTEFRNKRTATQMAIAAFRKRHRSLSLSSNSSNPATPSPTPISHENSSGSGISSHQSGPNYIGHSTTFREMMRRRRGESAFDINNIVIPYSMAASTRVEKLQYKEIITPKWRVIEDDEDFDNLVPNENNDQTALEDNDSILIEDLSDDAYTTRHQTCEIEEKKRFMTYVQHNKRGTFRGSRTDSGANSPDIFSSHESYHDAFPSSGISSPLTPPPSTGGNGEESHPTRRRSGSFCHQHRLSDDHRITPDITEDVTYVYVPPFDLRTFPLSEEDYEHLLEQPNTDIPKIEKRLGESCSLTESRPSSPISSTSGSVVDDPNDPEWTVVTAEKAKEGKPAIVLKISKR